MSGISTSDCWCGRHSIDTETLLDDILARVDFSFDLDSVTPCVVFDSRSLTNRDLSVSDRCDFISQELLAWDEHYAPDVIVSGGASGGDAIAEALALEYNIPMVVFAVNSVSHGTSFRRSLATEPWTVDVVTSYGDDSPDDYTTGRGAYMTRNCLMAELVSRLDGRGLALWDGDSPGTTEMLHSCRSHSVSHTVITLSQTDNSILNIQRSDSPPESDRPTRDERRARNRPAQDTRW